jgi:hypothetical protein
MLQKNHAVGERGSSKVEMIGVRKEPIARIISKRVGEFTLSWEMISNPKS